MRTQGQVQHSGLTGDKPEQRSLSGKDAARETSRGPASDSEFNYAPIGLLTLDHDLKILSANVAASEFLRTPFSELAERPLDHWIQRRSIPSFHEHMSLCKASCDPSALELQFQTGRGHLRWAEISTQLRTRSGASIFHCALIDTTDKKIVVDSMNRQRAKILNSSKRLALNKMAKGIAHQLNNPLTILQLRAEQIRRFQLQSENARTDLDRIANGIDETTQRMAKIINSLVLLGQADVRSEVKPVSLGSIVESALNLFQAKIRSSEISIELDPTHAEAVVVCQPSRVAEIVAGLIDNAFDAVSTVEAKKWIKISYISFEGSVEIAVSDNGPGIAISNLDRLFEPFFTTKAPGGSLGLSLCVARAYAEAQGGSLELDRHSPWTRFVLQLPKQIH